MTASAGIQSSWDLYKKTSMRDGDQIALLGSLVETLVAAATALESFLETVQSPADGKALGGFAQQLGQMETAFDQVFQTLDGFAVADQMLFSKNAIGGQLTLGPKIKEWQRADSLLANNLQDSINGLLAAAEQILYPDPLPD